MKFIDTYVKGVLVYGFIQEGHFTVTMWDFHADDCIPNFSGTESNVRKAWKSIHRQARKMWRDNQVCPPIDDLPYEVVDIPDFDFFLNE